MSATPHLVAIDPGTHWVKDWAPAIDTPPDSESVPAPEDSWPPAAPRSGLFGTVTPNVVRNVDGFRMYYTQILPRSDNPTGANDYDQSTTRILSATSTDAVTWTPEPGVRLSAPEGGAGDGRVVSPEVVPTQTAGQLRMYFECCTGPGVASSIRSAVSDDGGLTWTAEPWACLEGGGSYNAPRVLPLEDGHWRLYCGARGTGIISAISDDGGRTFEREPGVRLAPSNPYDEMTAFAPEVLRIAGAGYRMYYAGYGAPNRAYVLSAVSMDGLVWHKEPDPVIAPGGHWDGAKCSEMCVAPLPVVTGSPPSFRLFYEACDGTAADERGVWRIAAATSSPAR